MSDHFSEALGKTKSTLYSFGFILFFSGFFLLRFQSRFPVVMFWLLGILFCLKTAQLIWQKWHRITEVAWRDVAVVGLLSLVLVTRVVIPVGLLALSIAVVLFAIGMILLVDCWLVYRTEKTLSFKHFSEGLLHFLFGSLALFDLGAMTDLIYWVLGCYLMTLGISRVVDAYFLDKSSGAARKRMALPVLFSALIPVSSLNQMNRFLNRHKSDRLELPSTQGGAESTDLEVWIHTARKGFELMGHVDISYKGVTYAYGQYDPDKAYLGGILGEGVLFTLSSQDYLDSLSQEDWRAVFGYGIQLTASQREMIERNLEEISSKTIPFHLTTDTQENSYLGQLSQRYPVTAYKFKSSKFKTYFVMTTNCVLLADTILGNLFSDIVGAHGILTPGTYQDYFEKAYLNPHSAVTHKFVLGKQDIKETT